MWAVQASAQLIKKSIGKKIQVKSIHFCVCTHDAFFSLNRIESEVIYGQ